MASRVEYWASEAGERFDNEKDALRADHQDAKIDLFLLLIKKLREGEVSGLEYWDKDYLPNLLAVFTDKFVRENYYEMITLLQLFEHFK